MFVCVRPWAFVSSTLDHPQYPFYNFTHHPKFYQKEHMYSTKLARFDSECNEIH